MNKDSKIYVAGHKGLVGSAIHAKLLKEGYTNIITRTSSELDLMDYQATWYFFDLHKPEYVFMAAAKVGGVMALNKYGADSIFQNLVIQNNVIQNCYKSGVKKLMFMGSNCLYPKLAVEPLKEQYILAGKLEPTTEPYAIAKIAGIKMCEAYRKQYGCNFISVLPVNLYGENDNFDLVTAHVMPALLKKFHEAKKNNKSFVEVWGSGNQRREFMHVNDVADAALFLMLKYNDAEPINIGTGYDISIKDLALTIKDIVGYEGEIVFNTSNPEGIDGKLLDSSKIHSLGWKHKIGLEKGIRMVYNTFK